MRSVPVDEKCNTWDRVRWIFVIWTIFVPLLCLALHIIYHIHFAWVIGTFVFGTIFFIISYRISKMGQFKSTYEMVEKEIEIGNEDKLHSSKAYSSCDGCNVELSASDDVIELSCTHFHILCSECYNQWMYAISSSLGHTKNSGMTQAWRIQLQFALCPICDKSIKDGAVIKHVIMKQVHNINNNRHPNESNQPININNTTLSPMTNINVNVININQTQSDQSNTNTNRSDIPLISPLDERISSVSENSITSNNSKQQMLVKTVSLTPLSVNNNININLSNNQIQNTIHINKQSPTNNNNTNSDTSRGGFEIVSADFLNPP